MSIGLYERSRIAYKSAAAMLSATGTGKWSIGYDLCENDPDKTVLRLTPSKYIFRTRL